MENVSNEAEIVTKTFKEMWDGLGPQYALAYDATGIWVFVAIVVGLAVALIGINVYLGAGDKRENRTALWFFGIGALLVFASGMVGFLFSYDISMNLYEIGLIMLSAASLYGLFMRCEFDSSVVVQCFIISVFFLVWFIGALISPDTVKDYVTFMVIGIITAGLVFLHWLRCYILLCIARVKHGKWGLKAMGSYLFEHRYVVLIMLIVFALSIEILEIPFLYDNSIYYRQFWKAVRWDYTTGMAGRLHVCNHLCSGYALLMLPGIWLFNDYALGIHLVQIIYVLMSIGAFYGIVSRLFPKACAYESALMTAVFALSPALFGMLGSFNPDYGMMFLMVWFAYLWLRGDAPILTAVCGWLFINTKEPAVFLFAGFALGVYIVRFRKSEAKGAARVFGCLKAGDFAKLAVPPVLWVVDLFMPTAVRMIKSFLKGKKQAFVEQIMPSIRTIASAKGKIWGGVDTFDVSEATDEVDIGSINHFGIATENITGQLKNMFATNFMWLIAALIVAGAIALIIVKCVTRARTVEAAAEYESDDVQEMSSDTEHTAMKGRPSREVNASDAIIVAACMLIMITPFLYLYITFTFYRYVAPLLAPTLIILYALMYRLPLKRVVRPIIVGVIAALFIVSDYATIDPVMNAVGEELSLGEMKLANFDGGLLDPTLSTPSDYTLYNRQNWYWGGLLNRTFAKVENGRHSLVIIPNKENKLVWGAFSCEQELDYQGLYWDEENLHYCPVELSYGTLTTYGLIDDSGEIITRDEELDISDYNHWYYLDIPFGQTEGFDFESAIYNAGLLIESSEPIEYRGCKLTLYTLKWDWDRLVIEES